MSGRRLPPAPRLHPAAFALASDGTIFLNIADAIDPDRASVDLLETALRQALAISDRVFIGVPLRGRERAEVLRRLADAAGDAAGQLVGRRQRRARRRR
jgi:hypothetical protein